jgi:hypothetical protein
MSKPKSIPEARLLIADTITEAVLSFQLSGDESEAELEELRVNTEDFVDRVMESLQINITSVSEKYGIVCTMDPISPDEFILVDE